MPKIIRKCVVAIRVLGANLGARFAWIALNVNHVVHAVHCLAHGGSHLLWWLPNAAFIVAGVIEILESIMKIYETLRAWRRKPGAREDRP